MWQFSLSCIFQCCFFFSSIFITYRFHYLAHTTYLYIVYMHLYGIPVLQRCFFFCSLRKSQVHTDSSHVWQISAFNIAQTVLSLPFALSHLDNQSIVFDNFVRCIVAKRATWLWPVETKHWQIVLIKSALQLCAPFIIYKHYLASNLFKCSMQINKSILPLLNLGLFCHHFSQGEVQTLITRIPSQNERQKQYFLTITSYALQIKRKSTRRLTFLLNAKKLVEQLSDLVQW